MSFTNLTPDKNPDGTNFQTGTTTFGVRYFYFTFIPSSSSVRVFLSRNIYRNEEVITRVFTTQSPISLLTRTNVSNVILPCTFINGQIGLYTPSGSTYQNISNVPNFILNNLVVGNTYILESRTVYNDTGMDFGIIIRGAINNIISLIYISASLVPITPILPLPMPPTPVPPTPVPPIPIPPPAGLPPAPTGLTAVNIMNGISLIWNVVTLATSYVIYREEMLLSFSSTPNYIDSQVISGNPYKYRVSAVNIVGEGVQSLAVSITPTFMFTNVVPNVSPSGSNINDSNVRFYYHLFTPITSSIDVFCYNNQNPNQKAIIGIYDTTAPSTNIFTSTNISRLDSNVAFSTIKIGNISVNGLQIISNGIYTNSGTSPNFRINLPSLDLTTKTAVLKTYILEIASYKNAVDTYTQDFGLYFKNVSSDSLSTNPTQLIYNSVNILRTVPSPYIITYNFNETDDANYTNYIYPYIFIFQNVINVLQSIITTTHNARAPNRTNDMLVHFTIAQLTNDTLGESTLDKWKEDTTRSPDFTYEQSVVFNSEYFSNGYLTSPADFNGSSTVNNIPNIALFNVLLHEIIHGIGIFYNDSYNNSSYDVGWNPYLTNISDNSPWYAGPIGSSALSSYRAYYKNQNLQRIPVEYHYGAGTALSHWDEGNAPNIPNDYRYFNGIYHPAPKYEIMTGFLNKNDYMTGLTCGALKDYGYNVNLVCPYVVAHPFVNLTPNIQNNATSETIVKCMSVSNNEAIKHTIIMEKLPKPKPQQYPLFFSGIVRPVGFIRPVQPVFYFK
jgi:hypothetical protein